MIPLEYEVVDKDLLLMLFNHCSEFFLVDRLILESHPDMLDALERFPVIRFTARCGSFSLLSGLVAQGTEWIQTNHTMIVDALYGIFVDFVEPSISSTSRLALLFPLLPALRTLSRLLFVVIRSVVLWRCFPRQFGFPPVLFSAFAQTCLCLHDLQRDMRQDPSVQVWRGLLLCLHIIAVLPPDVLASHLSAFLSVITLCTMKAGSSSKVFHPSPFIHPNGLRDLEQAVEDVQYACSFDDSDLTFYFLLPSLSIRREAVALPFLFSPTAPGGFTRLFSILIDAVLRVFPLMDDDSRYDYLSFVRAILPSPSRTSPLLHNLLTLLWHITHSLKKPMKLSRWQLALVDMLKPFLGSSEREIRYMSGETLAFLVPNCEVELQTHVVNYLQSQLRSRPSAFAVSGCMFALSKLFDQGRSVFRRAIQPNLMQILVHESALFDEPIRTCSVRCIRLMSEHMTFGTTTTKWLMNVGLSQLLVDGGGLSHLNRTNVAVGYLKLMEYLLNRVNERILKEQTSSVLCLMNMMVWVKDHVNDVSVSIHVLRVLTSWLCRLESPFRSFKRALGMTTAEMLQFIASSLLADQVMIQETAVECIDTLLSKRPGLFHRQLSLQLILTNLLHAYSDFWR